MHPANSWALNRKTAAAFKLKNRFGVFLCFDRRSSGVFDFSCQVNRIWYRCRTLNRNSKKGVMVSDFFVDQTKGVVPVEHFPFG